MNQENSKISVLVHHDHDIYRIGLTVILKAHDEFELIDAVGSTDQLRLALETNQPDVLITSLLYDGSAGIQVIKEILAGYPHVPILVICEHNNFPETFEVVRAGVKGCYVRGDSKWDLIEGVKIVGTSGYYFSSGIIDRIAWNLTKEERIRLGLKELAPLSKDDITFLRLLCEENKLRQIARKMNTTFRKVADRKANLLRLLNARTAVGLMKYAVQIGIFDPFEWERLRRNQGIDKAGTNAIDYSKDPLFEKKREEALRQIDRYGILKVLLEQKK